MTRARRKRPRIVELVVHFVLAIVLSMPMLLGPARGPLLRALAADEVHHCACGMEAGKCGCPECKLTTPPPSTEKRSHVPTLRSGCEDGAHPLVGSAALTCVGASLTVLVPPSIETVPFDASPPREPISERARPPTPPPRRG